MVVEGRGVAVPAPVVGRADAPLRQAVPPVGRALAAWTLRATDELVRLRHGLLAAVRSAEAGPARSARTAAEDDGAGTLPCGAALVLLASELATNALRHGRPPVVVRLVAARGQHVVDVSDGAPGRVPLVAGPRAPGEGGFGLHLAQGIACGSGWYRTGEEKHVWAAVVA
ncbi:ATP-binding protein [Cellulomonas endophytica]|uniref:ATP-binding protein n=1 Tax=Cellulomonas endophytica TaxID=2494735 RepID=UPI0010113324|nr:ATP-binding protein [Cellulomonas endophytica]